MKNPFSIPGKYFYRRCAAFQTSAKEEFRRQQLQQLFPLENGRQKAEEFWIRRFTLVSVISLIGIVTVVGVILSSRNSDILTEGALLFRNDRGEGDYTAYLQATTGEWEREIPVVVHERELTNEEREKLLQKMRVELSNLIKGENQSLMQVTQKLNLVTGVSGYPFTISWLSSDHNRIGADGTVNVEDLLAEGEDITLTAIVADGKEKSSIEFNVHLCRKELSPGDAFFMELEKEIDRLDKEGQSNSRLSLPRTLNGLDISWAEKENVSYLGLMLLFMLSIYLVCRGMDKDLEQAHKRRKKQLMVDYNECVSKFRLYLSAGLTVKRAFIRITQDYSKINREKRNYLYEEMRISCHQLENGFAEERVYTEWGRRCGEMKYKQLSYLLSVHVKKGNALLLEQLDREAQIAQEDRQKQAKKLGEEAGVKLLFPMMLMLLIVMFLILLPVWMDFGSI